MTANIDLLMGTDRGFYKGCQIMVESGYDKVWNPDKIVAVIDHGVPAPTVARAEVHRKLREFVRTQNIKNFYDVGVGICHQLLPEKGHVIPGSLIVGVDSHTTTYGALGAASTGIGSSEAAYVLVKGSLWFMVPETIRFILTGNVTQRNFG